MIEYFEWVFLKSNCFVEINTSKQHPNQLGPECGGEFGRSNKLRARLD